MKKGVIVILLLTVLLILPLVFAQEQSEVYLGFERFVDNAKMFFSSGDSKIMLALEIREKELNSAIINSQNGEDEEAEKNIERARKKLQYVQNKVSEDTAESVKEDIKETVAKINEEDLTEDLEIYLLEEEKTQLIAELIIEMEGSEGQTLKREIVKDNETGQKNVQVVVEGETYDAESNNITNQIIENIVEIDEEITEWTIQKTEKTIDEAEKEKDNEDVSPSPNIVDDDIAPGPQGIVGNQGYSDDEGHYGEVPDDTSGASGEIDED